MLSWGICVIWRLWEIWGLWGLWGLWEFVVSVPHCPLGDELEAPFVTEVTVSSEVTSEAGGGFCPHLWDVLEFGGDYYLNGIVISAAHFENEQLHYSDWG